MPKDEAFLPKDFFFFCERDLRCTIQEFATLFAKEMSIYVPPSWQISMQAITVGIQNHPWGFTSTYSPFPHPKVFLIYPSMDKSDCSRDNSITQEAQPPSAKACKKFPLCTATKLNHSGLRQNQILSNIKPLKIILFFFFSSFGAFWISGHIDLSLFHSGGEEDA